MKKVFGLILLLICLLAPARVNAQCANATIAQFNGTTMVCSSTITNVTHTGGTATSLTSFSLDNTATAFNLFLASTDGTMSADRTITFNTQNGSRTLSFAGDLTFSGAITTSGSSGLLTFTYSSAPTVAFGSGGTVVYTSVTTLSSLVSIGTITTGVWNGTAVTGAFGGTGLTTAAVGDIIYASATTPVWSRLADVATGSVLVSGGVNTAPAWSAAPSLGTSVTSPFFDATTAASAYRINGASILFVSGNYTQINSPATTSAALTFGNTGDSSMYISANVAIIFRTTVPATYTTITPTSFATVLASSAQANAVCYNSSTNAITYNSGVTNCTASTATVKDLDEALSPEEGTSIVMAMRPWKYTYKHDFAGYVTGQQIGFVAEEVYQREPRLAALNDHGKPASVRYEQYTAALTAAFQKLKADNDNLKIEIDELRRRFAK